MIMTVRNMSRYIVDSYYQNYKNSVSSDPSAADKKTGTKNSSTDSTSSKKNTSDLSSTYASLLGMSKAGKNAIEKRAADSAGALADSSMSLVSASNYSFANRGTGTVDDGLAEKIKKFANDYNSTINSVKLSDNVNALRYGVSMVNNTKAFSKQLSKIGIKIEDNNTLTVDEDKLKSAKTEDVRKLFSGTNSFGSRMVTRSINLNFAAKNGLGVTYNSSGITNNYTNNFLNTLFNTMG